MSSIELPLVVSLQDPGAPTGLSDFAGCNDARERTFAGETYSESALGIITAYLADSTKEQYDSVLKRQWNFYFENKQNSVEVESKVVIELRVEKYKEKASYSSLNKIWSAISLISKQDLQQDPILHRFFKGLLRLRPTAPEHTKLGLLIWF